MRYKIIQVLAAILAISFLPQAQAKPWRWFGKAAVKPVQLSLPSNNGGVISVTVPSKSTATKRGIRHGRVQDSRTQDTTANQRDNERIAADIERLF